MKIPKPSDPDLVRFRELVPERPDVTTKPMFGNVAAFVNGNMFMGLFGSAIGVRLNAAQREELVALGGGPFGPPDRPMTAYVALPSEWNDSAAEPWIDRALDQVSALPQKVARSKKPAKPASR